MSQGDDFYDFILFHSDPLIRKAYLRGKKAIKQGKKKEKQKPIVIEFKLSEEDKKSIREGPDNFRDVIVNMLQAFSPVLSNPASGQEAFDKIIFEEIVQSGMKGKL